VREVAEEACARVIDYRYLACQHVWDPPRTPRTYHPLPDPLVGPCRARPVGTHHEMVQRLPVTPDRVLTRLSWHSKAIAARLLDAALMQDRLARDGESRTRG
jgi:hypothetical protein